MPFFSASFTKSLFLLVTVAVSGLAATRADVACIQHVGHGITPVDAPGIRMVSAKADIDWGDPGTLAAVFVMDNEEKKAADVQLGFPVPLPERYREKDSFNFTMSFDGVPIDPANIQQAAPAKGQGDIPPREAWFHCRHVFPPGVTTVRVQTKIPVTPAYHYPYVEDLSYCIQTGAGWKGRIGSEEVTVHFPSPVLPGQILSGKPASYAVEGNTVHWYFENFEPKHGDHDIELESRSPDVLPILAELRAKLAVSPHDPKRMLDLAKHLLALSDPRMTFPIPRDELPASEHRRILALLPPEDRARFQPLYARRWNGSYREKNPWTQDADALTSMLSAVHYVPSVPRTDYYPEGRDLLARLLREHPHDSDAWNVHLAYLFEDDVEYGGYPFQLAQTRLARQNCPNDPDIRSWDILARWVQRRRSQADANFPTPKDRRMYHRKWRLEAHLRQRGIYGYSRLRYHVYTGDLG